MRRARTLGLGFTICFTAFGATKVSLVEAFKVASERSETILQTKERLVQADARIDRLKGGIFPYASAKLSHTIQPIPSDPVARAFSPQHQTTLSLSVAQPLFRGLREWNGLSQLNHLKSAEEASQQNSVNRLFREVAANYLQILSYEQDLKNLAEQSELYDKRVKELSDRVERGESNQSDVVTAESTQASLRAEIRLSEGQLEVAREEFYFLTGISRDAELTDPKVLETTQLAPIEKYVSQIEARPDIAAAREQYEAAQKAVSVAWGAHFPTVDATGNYYFMRPGFLSDLKWDVGVQVTLPIFEGGATQAKVTEAVSQRKEAYLELEKLRRIALREVHSLHRQLSARLDQMKNLQKSAELSRKNTSLLARDYKRGLARSIDVQLALTEFRIAQRSFDQSHFASQLDMLQLEAAVGKLPSGEKTP